MTSSTKNTTTTIRADCKRLPKINIKTEKEASSKRNFSVLVFHMSLLSLLLLLYPPHHQQTSTLPIQTSDCPTTTSPNLSDLSISPNKKRWIWSPPRWTWSPPKDSSDLNAGLGLGLPKILNSPVVVTGNLGGGEYYLKTNGG